MNKKLWLLSCDIINHAYKDKEEKILKQYRHVYFEVSKKQLSSKHGDYSPTQNKIRIFNLSRDDESSFCTSLHELAHHIDYVNRGECDHSNEFYSVYKDLIKAAIEMGLITKDQILSLERDASDSNKLKKIVQELNVDKVEMYKADKEIIQVKNGFKIKEWLSHINYIWNGISQLWEKEISKENEEEELDKVYVLTNKENITIIPATNIRFDCYSNLIVFRCYEFRIQLFNRGYYYDKERKGLRKKINNKEIEEEISYLKSLGLNRIKIIT